MIKRTSFQMTAQPLDIDVGVPVRLFDGSLVGKVGALAPGRFRLSSDDVDVWLSQDAIFTADVGGVTLACELAGLHRYRTIATGR